MTRYIKINDQVALAKFSVPKSAKKAYVEFTRIGQTLPTLRHDPVSVDNGEAVFAWDKNARSQDQGWYVIRLFVGGCPCGEYTARVENACTSEFIGSDERDDCYECDGVPKADVKCCSTVINKPKCATDLCPNQPVSTGEKYTPTYEVPNAD